jgi:hypothetical protein
MLDYFPPQPNATGTFNWVIRGTGGNVSDQYNGRIDYNLSEKQRIFGRYSYWPMQDRTYQRFPGATGGFLPNGIGSHYLTQQAVIGDTYTLNPTTIFDVRISYLRQRGINGGANVGHTDMSKFGPAYANYNLSFSALPEAIYSGPNNLFNMTPISGWENNLYENYAIGASVVKIINVHSLKFGGEARRMSKNGIGNFPNAAGKANYNTSMTAIPGVTGSGDEFAAFLLGEFTNINLQTVIPTTTYNYSYALYGTDTWQVNHKLTLNLGLRWELPGAPGEKKDRTSVILPNQIDPTTGFNGAVVLVNSPLWKPRGMEPNRYVFFDPRVGFAYRLPASGVIRGGYGLVFTSNDMPSGIGAYNSPVAAAVTTQVNASVPTFFERNPFPNNVLQPAGRTRSNFSKDLIGQVAQGPVPTLAYTYFQQWNLSLSKQWKGDWLTEIAYLGSKGTHLAMQGFFNTGYDTVGLNQIPSAYYDHTTGIALTGPDTGKLLTANSSAPNAACAAWGAALSTAAKTQVPTVGQCLRPYPQFQDYQNGADYSGSSTYHAMSASATKRFGTGGRLNANWTWAKMITDADVVNGIQMESTSGGLGGGAVGYLQDFTNKKAERALGSFSTRQRAVISYVLDMPFGTGRKWLNSGGTLNYFIGGWSLNGITTFQSGFPIELNYNPNTFVTSFGGGTLRPNYTPGCNKKNSLSHYEKYANKAWFNAACFTFPGNFAFGNEPRVDPVLQADGVNNYDFAVLKATRVKERLDVQFRMEFFNILNRTQFLPPGNTVTGSNFNIITNTRNQPRVAQASLRVNF